MLILDLIVNAIRVLFRGAPLTPTELETRLTALAMGSEEPLDWRNSIVDLMKLLKLDSGLEARKDLAEELGYTGTLDGSAKMNIWLHKEVLSELRKRDIPLPDREQD